jgi:hypothetical protein
MTIKKPVDHYMNFLTILAILGFSGAIVYATVGVSSCNSKTKRRIEQSVSKIAELETQLQECKNDLARCAQLRSDSGRVRKTVTRSSRQSSKRQLPKVSHTQRVYHVPKTLPSVDQGLRPRKDTQVCYARYPDQGRVCLDKSKIIAITEEHVGCRVYPRKPVHVKVLHTCAGKFTVYP